MDKISVIMPCFNAEQFISRSVASVLGQSFQNLELLVINNGSTDRSLQILEQINDKRLIILSQLHRGVCAARNKGLDNATGDYIAFLDADDTWDRMCLEKLHMVLQKSPEAALSYCGWQNVGLPGGQGEPYVPPDYEKEIKIEHLLRSCPWPIHASLTHKWAIENAGKFDEQYTHAEDYKLWLRVAYDNTIIRVPEVLAFYHFHNNCQASTKRASASISNWHVQREFISEHSEIGNMLGSSKIRWLTHGILLREGYECYWRRDLEGARKIFKVVLKTGYGSMKDWKYMLPSILPLSVHRMLIRLFERNNDKDRKVETTTIH